MGARQGIPINECWAISGDNNPINHERITGKKKSRNSKKNYIFETLTSLRQKPEFENPGTRTHVANQIRGMRLGYYFMLQSVKIDEECWKGEKKNWRERLPDLVIAKVVGREAMAELGASEYEQWNE